MSEAILNSIPADENNDADSPRTYEGTDLDEPYVEPSMDDFAAELMKGWEVESEETPAEETTDDTQDEYPDEGQSEDESDPEQDPEEGDEDEVEEDPEEETEAEEDPKPAVTRLSDDAVVEVEVNGEVVQASVKDMKRLYGQEKALTQKSQQVAEARRRTEDHGAVLAKKLDAQITRATEHFNQFKDMDFFSLSRDMEPAAFTELRKEAQAAHENLQFMQNEGNEFIQEVQKSRNAENLVKAQECIQVLTKEIPEWSNAVYDDIRSYAVGTGLSAEYVNNLVEPGVIMALNKARLYDQRKKVVTRKKATAPKRVMKPKGQAAGGAPQKNQKNMQRLQETGSVDDAANAFLGNWSQD